MAVVPICFLFGSCIFYSKAMRYIASEIFEINKLMLVLSICPHIALLGHSVVRATLLDLQRNFDDVMKSFWYHQ